MFVYFQPQGGFNDILTITEHVLKYCVHFKRILLLDMVNSEYKINFSDYFIFKHPLVICDFNKIKELLSDTELSVYPKELHGKLNNVLDNSIKFRWSLEGYYIGDTQTKLILPPHPCTEKVIVFASVGGGNAINLFRYYVELLPHVKEYCQQNYSKLPKPYLAIQIRNTDHQCDYAKMYEDNKDLVHSYKNIYVATDDKKTIEFFREKGLNVYNFITFPESDYNNLHNNQTLDPDVKIKDLMSDVHILTLSDKILSVSKGGFIRFVRECQESSNMLKSKFL